MQTRLGSFVECVLTAVLVVCVASCSNPGPQPNPLPTQVASPVVPSTTASPSPSAEELKLHKAEGAVAPLLACHRSPFSRPGFRSDRAHDGFARLGGGPVGKEHQPGSLQPGQIQWKRRRPRCHGQTVQEARHVFRVMACIDVSGVRLRDEDGKSVVPLRPPPTCRLQLRRRNGRTEVVRRQGESDWHVLKSVLGRLVRSLF